MRFDTTEQTNAKRKKNTFITNLGWVFLVFSLYSAAASLAQIIYFLHHSPAELLGKFFSHFNIMEFLPPAFIFVFDHIHLFSIISLVFSLASTAASWAFIKRRDWGRAFFAAVMIVSIIFGAACLFILDAFNFSSPTNPGLREMTRQINRILRLYIIVLIPVIAAIHGWLAYKLLSKDIKDEFRDRAFKNPV
jgi:hypothetical protein